MIATILQSTPTFHAVAYNEKKVAEGVATLLEMKNFGSLDVLGYTGPQELQDYLIQYSQENSRVKNPQFHLVISCKDNEWSDEELLEFTHRYLQEMGYGNSEQPLLIYAHHDTENNHLHIVTSRVAPDGKKINDSNERIKSQKVLEKLLKQNIKRKAEKDIEDAKRFNFYTLRQFKSILEAMNYQCYETKGDEKYICVKKSGMTLLKIQMSELERLILANTNRREPATAERMKWRSILKKYRDLNSDIKGLEKDLRQQFGLALVFLGPKDAPFGYQVVDFNKKVVYDGNRILHINDLMKFMSKEEHIKEIENLIDKCLEENPYISTKELNIRLRRIGGVMKKDHFIFGSERIPIESIICDTLSRNNKMHYRQSFHPASQAEIDVLCRFTNYSTPELLKVEVAREGKYKKEEVGELFRLLFNKQGGEKRRIFEEAGYKILKNREGGLFVINLSKHTILDMTKVDMPQSMYADLAKGDNPKVSSGVAPQNISTPQNKHSASHSSIRTNMLQQPDGGTSQNREWEVGKRNIDRDDPDMNRNLSY